MASLEGHFTRGEIILLFFFSFFFFLHSDSKTGLVKRYVSEKYGACVFGLHVLPDG